MGQSQTPLWFQGSEWNWNLWCPPFQSGPSQSKSWTSKFRFLCTFKVVLMLKDRQGLRTKPTILTTSLGSRASGLSIQFDVRHPVPNGVKDDKIFLSLRMDSVEMHDFRPRTVQGQGLQGAPQACQAIIGVGRARLIGSRKDPGPFDKSTGSWRNTRATGALTPSTPAAV